MPTLAPTSPMTPQYQPSGAARLRLRLGRLCGDGTLFCQRGGIGQRVGGNARRVIWLRVPHHIGRIEVREQGVLLLGRQQCLGWGPSNRFSVIADGHVYFLWLFCSTEGYTRSALIRMYKWAVGVASAARNK